MASIKLKWTSAFLGGTLLFALAVAQPAIATDESPTPDNPRRAVQRVEPVVPEGLLGPCPGTGSCYAVHGTPGCSSADCCSAVCAIDSFCCTTEWDQICVNEALDLCGNCGDPGNGSCFVQHVTPGCNDSACCAQVCAIDAYCCDVEWDSICVDEAQELCGGCGDPANGSCFIAHATSGCDDGTCCGQVCDVDPYCCDVEWDSICVDQAQVLCAGCGSPTNGSCFVPHATAGCNNAECCATVCNADPFCCDNSWDSLCASEAATLCAGCGDPASGSCYASHGNTGCNNASCCGSVCAIDPFCCENFWDNLCANEAEDICGCPADIAPTGGDGAVNVQDLLAVIGSWGACFDCPADLMPPGNNNAVNVQDLLKVIGSWGPCADFCAGGFSCGSALVICPNGVSGCFCWESALGGTVCANDGPCVPCNNGQCPAGFICVVDTCCGVPVCLPECGTQMEGPPAPGQEISADTMTSSGRRWGDMPGH